MKTVAHIALRGYQLLLSPLWRLIAPNQCKYSPSCSEYSKQAIGKHGLVRGVWKTLGRISRCHPWGKGGVDLP